MTTSETNVRSAWKERTYPVPAASRRTIRLKASALRTLNRWLRRSQSAKPAVIVVPALFNRLPGENVALGWLNEIDALGAIRRRMMSVAKKTGWDVFTFHTQHNLDHYFDSTIAAVSETWTNEGSLSRKTVQETKKRYASIMDYQRIQPRLVENLVFQSSFMEWTARRAEERPFQFHTVGTSLYAALVWSGSMAFNAALDSVLKVGQRWDGAISKLAEEAAAQAPANNDVEWQRFELMRRIIERRQQQPVAVSHQDFPRVEAPFRPFWHSVSGDEEPSLIVTARDAAMALESLNLRSWSSELVRPVDGMVHGWLMSPLNALAGTCRWTVSNYLLATPVAVTMFMENLAGIRSVPLPAGESEAQKRFRLSRIKVTGP